MKYAGWVFLALYVAYRRTIKACDCEGLKRRLAIAHRETRDYQDLCRTMLYKRLEDASDFG